MGEDSENHGPEAQILHFGRFWKTKNKKLAVSSKVDRNRGSQTRVGERGPKKAKVARNRGSQTRVGERGFGGFGGSGGFGGMWTLMEKYGL